MKGSKRFHARCMLLVGPMFSGFAPAYGSVAQNDTSMAPDGSQVEAAAQPTSGQAGQQDRAPGEPPVAASAPATDDGSTGIEEITVTARRISENLQRVPVTITALTPETITRNNITEFSNLQRIVPSYQGGARFIGSPIAASLVRIRGVNGVASYFADVPYTIGQRATFFDIQNIQVLQGPQGTLFGEASNAGAIVITPQKPGNVFGGYVNLQVGDQKRKSIEGALDLPIVPDKVLLRIAGKTTYVQGFIQDIFSGHRVGRDDYDIFRATLTLRPTENLEIETLYSSEWTRGIVASSVIEDFNFFPSFNLRAAQAAVNGMTPAQFDAARDFVLATQLALGPYKHQGWSTGCFATDASPFTRSTVPGSSIAAVIPNSCVVGETKQHPQLLVNTVKWISLKA